MTNFFIEVNTTKPKAVEFAAELETYIYNIGHSVVMDLDYADVICSLGGDGTLINTWHKYGDTGIPIFGINCGHLGYLTEGTPDNYQRKIADIANKKCKVEKRICLEGVLNSREEFAAVNEFAFNSYNGKFFEYSIIVDNQVIQRAKGDGIICATPTGSTAYALSAGGSLIEPTIAAIELVAICPHSLMNRSILLPLDREIQIQAHTDGVMSFDGYRQVPIQAGDILTIKRYELDLKLIRVNNGSFIEKIAENFCKF